MASCISCKNYVEKEGDICNKCYQSFDAPPQVDVSGFRSPAKHQISKKSKKNSK